MCVVEGGVLVAVGLCGIFVVVAVGGCGFCGCGF